MNCNTCEDLILGGYIDHELSVEEESAVDAHVQICSACRALAETAANELGVVFMDLEPVRPPEAVWDRVKADIAPSSRWPFGIPYANFRHWLSRLRLPEFALGIAAVICVMLIAGKESAGPQTGAVAEFEKEVSYIAFMMDPDAQQGSMDGYGTAIEEYFL